VTDQLVISEDEGAISVPAGTLASIVVRAAELVDGTRVRRPRRGVDVELAEGKATVTLRIAARYGSVLPQVAEEVQQRVAHALAQMCGVDVGTVDVAIEELV
jgi:uncharacterized alkaline shock family protein YloU